MDMTAVLAVLGGCAGVLAAARLGRGAWRVNRRIVRIADLVQELSPNGGGSMRDVIDRTERKVDGLSARLSQHIDNHPGG